MIETLTGVIEIFRGMTETLTELSKKFETLKRVVRSQKSRSAKTLVKSLSEV